MKVFKTIILCVGLLFFLSSCHIILEPTKSQNSIKLRNSRNADNIRTYNLKLERFHNHPTHPPHPDNGNHNNKPKKVKGHSK